MSRRIPETHRKDENHDEIEDGLRHIPQMGVYDTHNTSGLGDLLTWRGDRWCIVEIKPSEKAELSEKEEKTRDLFGDHWMRANCLEDVLRFYDLMA